MRSLYTVNQARAALTGTASTSMSLRQLRDYQQRLDAASEPVAEASEPVEEAVQVIRDQPGLPPAGTS